ncbi:MAG: pyridinium-3,5-bisthiocarboxylic acid mononucleotide nickel chelatase, partial [Actinomycetota bacterium]|nr:pyridinium-3,5-bisthiocarboxylic acid mononucleotide nickel chelatase [Actinomycetota bacterium]
MKTLYIDCSSGASGDMLIGAFMDLGVDPKLITEAVRGLPFTVRDIGLKYVSKNGIRAIESVIAWDGDETTERRYVDIVMLLEASQLAPNVRQRALDAFRVLAEAEAKIHMSDIDEVHFHEVGSDDAIIDIVGACAAL